MRCALRGKTTFRNSINRAPIRYRFAVIARIASSGRGLRRAGFVVIADDVKVRCKHASPTPMRRVADTAREAVIQKQSIVRSALLAISFVAFIFAVRPAAALDKVKVGIPATEAFSFM